MLERLSFAEFLNTAQSWLQLPRSIGQLLANGGIHIVRLHVTEVKACAGYHELVVVAAGVGLAGWLDP